MEQVVMVLWRKLLLLLLFQELQFPVPYELSAGTSRLSPYF
jgi:hypothetical protein